ncbi:unnamed protein product, partial [Mesorhabditis spiculigera]
MAFTVAFVYYLSRKKRHGQQNKRNRLSAWIKQRADHILRLKGGGGEGAPVEPEGSWKTVGKWFRAYLCCSRREGEDHGTTSVNKSDVRDDVRHTIHGPGNDHQNSTISDCLHGDPTIPSTQGVGHDTTGVNKNDVRDDVRHTIHGPGNDHQISTISDCLHGDPTIPSTQGVGHDTTGVNKNDVRDDVRHTIHGPGNDHQISTISDCLHGDPTIPSTQGVGHDTTGVNKNDVRDDVRDTIHGPGNDHQISTISDCLHGDPTIPSSHAADHGTTGVDEKYVGDERRTIYQGHDHELSSSSGFLNGAPNHPSSHAADHGTTSVDEKDVGDDDDDEPYHSEMEMTDMSWASTANSEIFGSQSSMDGGVPRVVKKSVWVRDAIRQGRKKANAVTETGELLDERILKEQKLLQIHGAKLSKIGTTMNKELSNFNADKEWIGDEDVELVKLEKDRDHQEKKYVEALDGGSPLTISPFKDEAFQFSTTTASTPGAKTPHYRLCKPDQPCAQCDDDFRNVVRVSVQMAEEARPQAPNDAPLHVAQGAVPEHPALPPARETVSMNAQAGAAKAAADAAELRLMAKAADVTTSGGNKDNE